MTSSDKNATLSRELLQIYGDSHVLDSLDREEQESLSITARELKALADCNLGKNFDSKILGEVIKHIHLLHLKQDSLVANLYKREISRAQYLKQFSEIARSTFDECEKLMGEENFVKMFGVPPSEAETLIDPELFLATGESNY